MPAFRPTGSRDGFTSSFILPGDIIIGGENLVNNTLATAGSGTWLAHTVVSGFIYRTGPGIGYTDITPTASQIIAALAGNMPAADLVPGNSFRMKFFNTVASAMTLNLGTGVQIGLGSLGCGASLIREYLWTIVNTTPDQLISCSTTNGSPIVNFVLPPGMASLPFAVAGQTGGINVTPGATISGTGVTTGTTVAGLIYGQGGITGITMSANATATANPVGLTFGSTMRLDTLGSQTL